jgi:hypothetical protein
VVETLQAIIAALTITGLPSWTGLILALLLGLLVLAFLGMPFAVYGVKSRLEALEMQVAELRAELRRADPAAAQRAPRAPVEQDWEEPPGFSRREPQAGPRVNPPVPPPPAYGPAPLPENRAEPRLDWRPPRG